MEGGSDPTEFLSGFLYKRRQTMKFQWRCYRFILTDVVLSYYKVTTETDEKGTFWGKIEIKLVQSVRALPKINCHYPLELVLESGKIVLLSAHNKEEQSKWLQALWKVMGVSSREGSSCSETAESFNDSGGLFTPDTGIKNVGSSSKAIQPGSCGPHASIGHAKGQSGDEPVRLLNEDTIEDMDTFIDRIFDGITFNRQSIMCQPSHSIKRTPASFQGQEPAEKDGQHLT